MYFFKTIFLTYWITSHNHVDYQFNFFFKVFLEKLTIHLQKNILKFYFLVILFYRFEHKYVESKWKKNRLQCKN